MSVLQHTTTMKRLFGAATALAITVSLLLGALFDGALGAEPNYPTRPVTFIIPLPPGGNSELATRLMIRMAEKHLGQPIVPVNKPGGGLTIGIAEIARAKPDGYTIGFTAFGPMTVTPFLQKVPYDPVNDFRQIMQYGSFNLGLTVHADSPFKSLSDIVAYARRSQKKLTFGAVATGLNPTIMKKIAEKEGIEFAAMPFGSTGPAEVALLGKHVDMVVGDFSPAFIEAGQTRLIVLFRDERAEEYPQVPTLKELGYNIPCRVFMGVQGPKGMPEIAVRKLEDAFTRGMKEP
ncbi:MAG: tripartite tricarboxylate transporter substrate binding protein, partial [candidate division WOR-3 bacterium]